MGFMQKQKMVTFVSNAKKNESIASPEMIKSKASVAGTEASPGDAVTNKDSDSNQNLKRRGAVSATEAGQVPSRTRKQKDKPYILDQNRNEPEDREGMLVQHPDMSK